MINTERSTPHPENSLVITPEEREGFERYWNWYIDEVVCVPETNRAHEQSGNALRIARKLNDETLDHAGFIDDVSAIALTNEQPTFARLTALSALDRYEERVGHPYTDDTLTIREEMRRCIEEWIQFEEIHGQLTEDRREEIIRQQLLLYAAMCNGLGVETPVDVSSKDSERNSKAMRVVSEMLRGRMLSIRIPSKDLASVWSPEEHISQTSGIPFIRVLCPIGNFAQWEKMEEACAKGTPVEIGRFVERLPSALVGIETVRRIHISPATQQISRKGTLRYLRLSPLPEPQESLLRPFDDIKNVSEEELTEGSAINNMSYFLAMRVIKSVEKRRRESAGVGSGTYRGEYRSRRELPLVVEYTTKAVRKLTNEARHSAVQRRIDIGLPIAAQRILDLANIEHRHETGESWDNLDELSNYLNKTVCVLLTEYIPNTQEYRLRSPEEVDQLAIMSLLKNSSLDTLADIAHIFLNDGDREHLTPEQLNNIESSAEDVRAIVDYWSADSISSDEQREFEQTLREFLQDAMQVRFETIRDLPVSREDAIKDDDIRK